MGMLTVQICALHACNMVLAGASSFFFFKGLTFHANRLHPRVNEWQVHELVLGEAGSH